MSSPRKFAEKIALIQQKQAEDDAAFHTIIYEVEAAKQKADRPTATKGRLDVPTRKYEISNGINHSDSNNHTNQPTKTENRNGSDRLLLPPDNPLWRRTHSDPALHQSMIPPAMSHFPTQINNEDQQLNFDMNDTKMEIPSYLDHQHHQNPKSQIQPNHYYDLNNNNYAHDQANNFYSSIQTPQQTTASPTTTNTTHTLLGPRFSGGNYTSNSLMLPPHQHPRGGGGSLPDLRIGNGYNNQQVSYSTVPSPPQHYLRSPSPQSNGDGDLYTLGPQQQSPSRVGPLKQSPGLRRRHSPIGEVKQSSPRRQHSPSPDVSSTSQIHHRIEPQTPPSLPSYSPQNSPHFLPNSGNDFNPFSPQQQSTDTQQPYYTLPRHFDQITLDNNFYPQPSISPSSQPRHNHSLPTTPGVTNDLHQTDFYQSFLDDMAASYCHNPSPVHTPNHVNQKSPTIPNIILTDVDSSKLDLSKQLSNDFSNPFDSLMDPTDLQLNADDFLLNADDLSVDPNICDDTFRLQH